MTIDPRLDKLVEALDRLWQLPHDPDQRQIMEEMYELASTPLKELPVNSGMDKKEWENFMGYCIAFKLTMMANVCRQIAEGLSND